MEQAAHSVFISYARADSDWVTIAVNLLRAGGAKVFMDIRDLAYGDKWEEVLVSKLHEVERVMVFWSRHAADSEWVNREWQLALNNGKRLVPVPIDDTPLPDDTVEPDSFPVALGERTHRSRPPEALGRRVVDMVFSDPDRVDAG